MILDLIEQYLPAHRGVIVLHWFTGSKAEARRAVQLGCYFSVNAAMLRNDRARALVASLPLNRLLTETDGPFTEIAGNPAKPSDVAQAVNALASLHRKSTAEIGQLIRANLKFLLEPTNG
jgi:TatD DNase family protein